MFTSWASDLVANDANLAPDVFVYDLGTGVTTLLSTDRDGGPADGPSGSPGEELPGLAFSANGRWVVFESTATDLIGNDTNGAADLFARSWRPPH
jgi:hypothetical protein